jgi:transposase-like protein
VEKLEGDAASKRRLRVVLKTLTGELSIEEACGELGVGASRFHALRHQALEGALTGLVPGTPGRPRTAAATPEADRLAELERENRELKLELQAAFVRTEVALALPHLLTKEARAEIKKKGRQARRQARARGSGGTGSGT